LYFLLWYHYQNELF